jgi:hypothetical protein
MVAVKYDDLSLAFEFVSAAPGWEHHAYISLDTGRVYWTSELDPFEEEKLPEDLESSDRYIAVPHKKELDLGVQLALQFAAEKMPNHYQQAEGFFRRRGAYARFKELLESEGMLDAWYKFEAEAEETAIREWCDENGVEIVESPCQ